jgi:hypothetical protein
MSESEFSTPLQRLRTLALVFVRIDQASLILNISFARTNPQIKLHGATMSGSFNIQ